MNLPLIVNPEAEADLDEARIWYEARRPGLGSELLDCVREVFDRIRRTPRLYGKVFQDLRLALVRRFPYVVIYRVDDDQITIVAVYHTRRIRGTGRRGRDASPTLFQRHEGPTRRADVTASRSQQLIPLGLFDRVGGPAGDAGE